MSADLASIRAAMARGEYLLAFDEATAILVGDALQVLAFDRDGYARIAYPFGTRQSQWVEDLPKIVREDWS